MPRPRYYNNKNQINLNIISYLSSCFKNIFSGVKNKATSDHKKFFAKIDKKLTTKRSIKKPCCVMALLNTLRGREKISFLIGSSNSPEPLRASLAALLP